MANNFLNAEGLAEEDAQRDPIGYTERLLEVTLQEMERRKEELFNEPILSWPSLENTPVYEYSLILEKVNSLKGIIKSLEEDVDVYKDRLFWMEQAINAESDNSLLMLEEED